MKKLGYIFIGVLAGLVLGLSASVYGASGLVGKVIQQEVKVVKGDETIGTAIVVDGRSYAPVRVMSESVGYKVDYTKEQITLTEPVKEEPIVEPEPEESNNDPAEEPTEGPEEPGNTEEPNPTNPGVTGDDILTEKISQASIIYWNMSNLSREIQQKRRDGSPTEEINQMMDQLSTMQAEYDALQAEIAVLRAQQ